MEFEVLQVIPVLRIFDVPKAKEFYIDFLAFLVDWEHRYEPDMPLYFQISRSGLVLHLSEHHGDGSPGAVIFLRTTGLASYHAELAAKRYPYARPGIETTERGSLSVTVGDPFGNRLRFDEAAPVSR